MLRVPAGRQLEPRRVRGDCQALRRARPAAAHHQPARVPAAGAELQLRALEDLPPGALREDRPGGRLAVPRLRVGDGGRGREPPSGGHRRLVCPARARDPVQGPAVSEHRRAGTGDLPAPAARRAVRVRNSDGCALPGRGRARPRPVLLRAQPARGHRGLLRDPARLGLRLRAPGAELLAHAARLDHRERAALQPERARRADRRVQVRGRLPRGRGAARGAPAGRERLLLRPRRRRLSSRGRRVLALPAAGARSGGPAP